MTSQYLLVNHYPVMEGKEKEIQDLAEKNSKALPQVSSFYISQDEGELIEFISLSSLNELAKYENNLASAFTDYANYLCGDIKRELLTYVESPISSSTAVPQTRSEEHTSELQSLV